MIFDVFRKYLDDELAMSAMHRYFALQAKEPLRGKARGGRVSGIIRAYKANWVGNRRHGLTMFGYYRRSFRRKPGKVDYGKPVPDRKRNRTKPPDPRARVAVADPPVDEYPC